MSYQAKRVARVVLRCHPAVWRARYGAEVAALLDESEVGVREVLDLAGSAAREWRGTAWRAVFDERSPLGELASIVLQAIVAYGVGVLLFDDDTPRISAQAWTALNLWRLAFLTIRCYLIVNVGAACLDAINRRARRLGGRCWFQGVGRLVLLASLTALDLVGSRTFHLWSSSEDLWAVYGVVASLVPVLTFIQHFNRGWLDMWRFKRQPAQSSGQNV